MDVLRRIEEIVAKAVAAGERELPRNLAAKVAVLLREQVETQAERAKLIAQAADTFGKRYAAQLTAALERAAADAPAPPPPPPAIPAPTAARAARPTPPKAKVVGRGVTTRIDEEAKQLARVPEGLRVFYLGHGATIEPPGIVLDDGPAFDSPTPAAMRVNRGEHVNGWSVWKVADGRSLQQCWDTQAWPEV
jgi:hypothetical protein